MFKISVALITAFEMCPRWDRFHKPLLVGLWLCAGCNLPWQDWDLLFLQSPGPPTSSPADLGLQYEDIRIPVPNGNRMAGWFVPAGSGKPLATFLVHTGMRGNLATYLSIVPWAAQNDFNIMIYDWEGFGASEGFPDFTHFEPDTRAAMDYLLSRPESAGGVIQLGASFGTSSALMATTEYPNQTIGLLLYGSSFTDDFATSWLQTQVSVWLTPVGNLGDFVFSALLPDFFENRRYLHAIHVPILAVTPDNDTIVPPEAQIRFYAALPSPKERYIAHGNHVHAPDTDPDLGRTVVAWAKSLPALPRQKVKGDESN